MHAIWVEKVRMWAIGTVALAALGGGTGWVLVPANAQPGQPAPPAVAQPTAKPAIPPAAPPLTPEQLTAEFRRLFAETLRPSALAEAAPTDDDLQKLRKQCYQSAHTEVTARMQAFQFGTTQGTIDVLLDSITKRLLTAEAALSNRPSDKLAAIERSLSILKLIEAVNDVRYRTGRIPIQDFEQTRFERLNMEIKVVEAIRAGALREAPVRR